MTPQEIYQYADEHDLIDDIWNASFFNKAGFDHEEVAGELGLAKAEDENGKNAELVVCAFLDGIEEPIETGMPIEEYQKILDNDYPVYMELVYINEEIVGVQLAVADGGESEEEINDLQCEAIVLGFVEYAGIDTVEKLEQVIREGQELMPPEAREDLERAKAEWEAEHAQQDEEE